jgi:hypothetical protein
MAGLMSVSDTNPETNEKYGVDEELNTIKKGIMHEKVIWSWKGITEDVLVNGTEDLTELRTKVAPYVFPIPTSTVIASQGTLSNDGYAIRNK